MSVHLYCIAIFVRLWWLNNRDNNNNSSPPQKHGGKHFSNPKQNAQIKFSGDAAWKSFDGRIRLVVNPFMPTVPTFAVRETDVSRHNGGASGAPLMPRDVSLSDSKCLNGGHEWVKALY